MAKTTLKTGRGIGEWLSEEEVQAVHEVFTGLNEDGATWRALQMLLLAHEAQGAEAAISPGLSSEDRHYWAGRAVGRVDVRDLLEAARKGQLVARGGGR